MIQVNESGSRIDYFVFVIITTTCVGKIFARNRALLIAHQQNNLTTTLVRRHSVASFDNDNGGNCGLCRLTFRAAGSNTFNFNTTKSEGAG